MRQRARRVATGVVFSGGGTAGHVLPALAIADAYCARGHLREEVLFLGSKRGMESGIVTSAGYALVALPGRGIVRRLSVVNVVAGFGLLVALGRSLRILAARRPGVVVSLGGYASIPGAFAAILSRIPVVVVNIDAVPGAANRLVGRFARSSMVGSAKTSLPRAVVTGVPVREAVLAVERSAASRAVLKRARLSDPARVLVVVIGGSLGARRLNDAAIGLAARFSARSDLALIHIAGARDCARVEAAAAERALGVGDPREGLEYRVLAYDDHLPELFGAADLVISRAGASTVAEIAAIGVPSILVPLPNAPGDHQRLNAEALASTGAAILVDDSDATAEHLGPILEQLVSDAERRCAMARAARTAGSPHAAAHIAALVEDVANAPKASRR